jgi:hypothetical protein
MKFLAGMKNYGRKFYGQNFKKHKNRPLIDFSAKIMPILGEIAAFSWGYI